LLRPSRAGAKPASGCDEDGCCTLRFRHLAQLRTIGLEERGGVGPAAHSPYHVECANAERFPMAVGKSSFCCSALAQMIELSKV
jgi:hypothetical protein